MIKLFFVIALTWAVLTIVFWQSTVISRNDSSIKKQTKRRYLPRSIYLGTTKELIEHTHQLQQQQQTQQTRQVYLDEYTLNKISYINQDKNYKGVNFRERMFDQECVAMDSWQESSFLSCNQIHEMGLLDRVVMDEFRYVASGGWNEVFHVTSTLGLDPALALKILSPKRGNPDGLVDMYKTRNFERVRQDALILERLSSSKHIMDIYAYCGIVIVGPFADGGTLEEKGLSSLKRKSSPERLKLMLDAAQGLAAIHEYGDIPSIVHGDLTEKQYMFVREENYLSGFRLVLADFNQAILIKRNSTAPDTACTFHRIDPDYGVFRSPEEYSHIPQTEKTDVWALGSIIYHILTGKKVWRAQYKKKDAEKAMIRGELPLIDDSIRNSNDLVDQTLLNAFKMCYVYDPRKRPSAKDIARYLEDRWLALEGRKST
ncbi:hypothetical protein ACHAWC_009354 [Mediolabrus comicus]